MVFSFNTVWCERMMKSSALNVLLILVLYQNLGSGHAQTSMESSPFQCQFSSGQSGQVFTPNIPDFYFNHENAAAFRTDMGANLTTSQFFRLYIFTIPPFSTQRNCSGMVTAIQYCYQAQNDDLQFPRTVFTLLLLSQNGLQFTVNNSIVVISMLTASICKGFSSGGVEQICCDIMNLNQDEQFQISSSQYTFGVRNLNFKVQPLAFAESVTEYQVERFQIFQSGGILQPGSTVSVLEGNRRANSSLLLIRFLIDSPTSILNTSTPDAAATQPVTTEGEMTTGSSTTSFSNSTNTPETVLLVALLAVAVVLILVLIIVTLSILLVRRAKSTHQPTPPPHVPPVEERNNTLENETDATITDIVIVTNECYATSHLPPTPWVHQECEDEDYNYIT